MKSVRVLHTEWSDGWGGQEIRIISEMIAIREHGVEVFLACRDKSQIKLKAIEKNIHVFTMPFGGNVDFKTIFALRKVVKEFDIDIINTHSGKDTWVGGIAAKLSGIKFIRTRHLSNPIKKNRLNFINELADFIFTTGEKVKEDMIKNNRIDPSKIQSIPTGIDTEIYNPKNFDRIRSRKFFELPDDHIVIGIIAVLRQFKRHDLFLEMSRDLLRKFPNKKFVFIIAGDGPQKESLLEYSKKLNIESNVRFLGHVDNVAELLSAIDIFVLSSDSKEGVPQSVMQALLMEKYVVATSSGSTEDLLHDNNFQLVSADSRKALTEGVSSFLDFPEKRNIGCYVQENFSRTVMVKKIIHIYNGILS